MEIDEQIKDIDTSICKNIDKFVSPKDRGILSQNILDKLRNLVEHVAIKIWADGEDISDDYKASIIPAVKWLRTQGKYRFLFKFHALLQISVSHYTPDEKSFLLKKSNKDFHILNAKYKLVSRSAKGGN
jgi:hypothetical protein